MSKEIIGKCPLCGGNVFDNPKSFGCGNWKEKNCKFTIWHDCHGHTITPEEAKALISGKEIGPFHLTSKAGKAYVASMYYDKKEKKVQLKFPPREEKEPEENAEQVPEPETENEDPDYQDAGYEEDGLPFN